MDSGPGVTALSLVPAGNVPAERLNAASVVLVPSLQCPFLIKHRRIFVFSLPGQQFCALRAAWAKGTGWFLLFQLRHTHHLCLLCFLS